MNLDRIDNLAASLTALQMQLIVMQNQLSNVSGALPRVSSGLATTFELIGDVTELSKANTVDYIALKMEVENLREIIQQHIGKEVESCVPSVLLSFGYLPR